MNYLTALSVLCQGYVAVMAVQEDDHYSSEVITQCLGVDWDQFSETKQFKDSIEANLRSKVEDVQSVKGWWFPVFEKDLKYVESIKKEWGVEPSDNDLAQLLSELEAKGKITTGAVEKACIALHAKLSEG